jgi:hypothetical protein
MGYWPYKELFSDHKKPSHRIFFETGTYMGDSVQDAIDLGFETIISVEIEPHFFDESYKRFMPLDIWGPRPTETPELYLYKGDSSTMMPELLQKVNRPALFWLDAHRNGYESPIKHEIEHILNHEIDNHTVIIDDLEFVEMSYDLELLEVNFLNKNANYKFLKAKASDTTQLIITT